MKYNKEADMVDNTNKNTRSKVRRRSRRLRTNTRTRTVDNAQDMRKKRRGVYNESDNNSNDKISRKVRKAQTSSSQSDREDETSYINVSKNDYILIDIGKGKPKLAMALGTKGDSAILEEGIENPDNDNHITYRPEQVVANLGANPRVSTYAGVKVEPFINTISSDEWGDIHIYRNLSEKDNKAIFSALGNVYANVKKNASVGFLPLKQIKIKNKGGKYAGSYSVRNQGEERLDKIELFPITFEDREYNEYLLTHECGHGVWYRCMSLELRSMWIEMYSNRVALEDVNRKVLANLFSSIASYEGSLRDYIKEIADEQERLLIKDCQRFLKVKRHLGADEFETLMGSNPDLCETLWPKRSEIDSVSSDVTAYAMVSAYEFFAESFAYHMTGKKLPRDITRLMKRTLKRLRKY